MKILVDMNLAPRWCDVFRAEGWEVVHWAAIGRPDAPERQIMNWAARHGYMVFTHDLDFGAILAATSADAPSIIQVRTRDVLPEAIGAVVVRVIREHHEALARGALIVVDPQRQRVRILPLHPGD